MYKFRHVDMLPERKTIRDHFKECLKQTISFYYYCMIDKREKSLDNLFSKWESVWFTGDIDENFSEEEVREGSNRAVELLRNFYAYNKEEKVFPVAVDFKYETIFEGSTNIHTTGTIDLIKVVNDKSRSRETDIVFFTQARTMPDDFFSSVDIRYTMASYAFRNNFKEKESNIVACNIGKKKNTYIKKTGSDYERARKIIYNIANGIENKIFFPSDNPVTCNKCKYKVFCMNEKAMEDKGNAICKGSYNGTQCS
jgi:hypothetical protein